MRLSFNLLSSFSSFSQLRWRAPASRLAWTCTAGQFESLPGQIPILWCSSLPPAIVPSPTATCRRSRVSITSILARGALLVGFPQSGRHCSVVARHNQEFSIRGAHGARHAANTGASAHMHGHTRSGDLQSRWRSMHEVYRGRIDDRYIAIGRRGRSPSITISNLRSTLRLPKSRVPQPTGPPVGCSVVFLQK